MGAGPVISWELDPWPEQCDCEHLPPTYAPPSPPSVDPQALDEAVRRFPMLLRAARWHPKLSELTLVWSSDIRFEYRHILRERRG